MSHRVLVGCYSSELFSSVDNEENFITLLRRTKLNKFQFLYKNKSNNIFDKLIRAEQSTEVCTITLKSN